MYGGAIYSSPSEYHHKSNINSTLFSSCSALYGGALYLSDSDFIINNSTFQNNNAEYYGLGEGGSIYIEYPNKIYVADISNSYFSKNYASISGGGIQWYDSQPVITGCSFDSNYAIYGNDIASFPSIITLSDSRMLYSNIFPPGQLIENPIIAYIKDHYNQTVVVDSQSAAQLELTNISEYLISGQNKVTAMLGIFNFSDIIVAGPPNSQTTLILIGDFTSFKTGMLSLNISIELRNCTIGEALMNNNHTCSPCSNLTYNLQAETLCKACPIGGICYGKANIVAAAGYWRTGPDSDIFYPCPNSAACLQERLNNANGSCLTGYKGVLCQSCELGYSSENGNICNKCLDDSQNILMLIGMIVLILTIVVIITISNIKGAYKDQSVTSIYFKILMNYIQIVMLTMSFKLNWPAIVREMFSDQSKVGGSSDRLFSIDCFIGDKANPYYAKLILLSMIPLVFGLILLLAWLVWGKLKKSICLKEKIIGSIAVQLFFFQPSLIRYNFSMFNCIELNSGEYYLTQDMSIECWKTEHLIYSLTVVIPSILIWCISIPIILVIILYKNKSKLSNIEEKLKYGFLYKGFIPNRYYWEFLTLLRKMLIISCSVFLSNISVTLQALVAFIIILSAYILQQKYEPYALSQLNQMESKSIIVSAVTIYSGLFFLTNDLNNDSKILLFIMMLLSNLFFLGYWIYYTFGYYLGKIYLHFNCCKRLLGTRMKTWVSKIVPVTEEQKNDTKFEDILSLNRKSGTLNLERSRFESD